MVKFSLRRLLSRRQFLTLGISSATALTILSLGQLPALSWLIYPFKDRQSANTNRQFKVVGSKSLRQRAKSKGLIYGAWPHVNSPLFDATAEMKSVFAREFGLVVTGFYWDAIRPSPSTFNFTEIDYFAKFAAENNMLMRGHPLVWTNALPAWIKPTLNRQNVKQILTDHIKMVVGRYAGKMHSWDVVNEAIDIGSRPDNLTKNIWLELLGPDYIKVAFDITARFDSKALLVYNETNLEHNEAQQVAVLKLLTQLKSQGTPVHALGIQSHLSGDRDYRNIPKFKKFLRDIAKLGLKIMITELDVIDKDLPTDIKSRDRLIAGTYEDYLTTVLAEPAVIAIINWGFTDPHTWISGYAPRKDGTDVRPLPFDRDLKPKLAWNAIARAIDLSPKRQPSKKLITNPRNGLTI
ncbi:endo-1,4-beta-xylanase [Chamaesiphon sp. GL140_3_metabinner_50]|uniref:endo-1,4-beta-xylanase n=1 Tax=Chamaesiphon sp. GL140_3_metabinner_50 TaxID=2970812 RepID=UPI0025DA96B3|nr:endo-1,4-beta-xylanase [Chamaesiphon sp. GL140_3_metabinner_50]